MNALAFRDSRFHSDVHNHITVHKCGVAFEGTKERRNKAQREICTPIIQKLILNFQAKLDLQSSKEKKKILYVQDES